MNAYQAEVMGLDASAAIGLSASDVFDAESAARMTALDRLVMQDRGPIHSFEQELTNKAGELRVFLASKSALRNSSHQTIGVVTSCLDITARKAAEQHLQHMAHHDFPNAAT